MNVYLRALRPLFRKSVTYQATNHLVMSGLNLPVDDLELLSLPPRPDHVQIPKPRSSFDFGAISQSSVPDLIVVWTFLSIFGYVLTVI